MTKLSIQKIRMEVFRGRKKGEKNMKLQRM